MTGDDYKQAHALGANFTYRPWDVAFSPVFSAEGQAPHIFSWTRKWGKDT
jgi:phage-related protein